MTPNNVTALLGALRTSQLDSGISSNAFSSTQYHLHVQWFWIWRPPAILLSQVWASTLVVHTTRWLACQPAIQLLVHTRLCYLIKVSVTRNRSTRVAQPAYKCTNSFSLWLCYCFLPRPRQSWDLQCRCHWDQAHVGACHPRMEGLQQVVASPSPPPIQCLPGYAQAQPDQDCWAPG